MKTRLTLQEKLRDLRDEKKLTLIGLSEAVGIPTATLQRLEANEDNHAAFSDVATLARFYDVSCDYLFGLTDNRRHRNVEVDALRLSDAAIEVLKGGNLNNRLTSEVIAHDDFPALLSAIEIYVDRKVMPQMNTLNQLYQLAEEKIKEQGIVQEDDEVLSFLQQAVVNEDEYLRFRISERFNDLMKKLFDAHKKDALPEAEMDALKEIKEGLQTYQQEQKKVGSERAQLIVLAGQIGLNIRQLTDEEIAVLMKALNKSQKLKRYRGRK